MTLGKRSVGIWFCLVEIWLRSGLSLVEILESHYFQHKRNYLEDDQLHRDYARF